MFGSRKVITQPTTPYATRADFCRVFREHMNRLYLLSFLLTGDRNLAEQCFVSGLRMSSEGNPTVAGNDAGYGVMDRPEIASIIALPSFERFVFVMSVLEGHSNQECSVLLGCTRREVMEARERALRRTGEEAEVRRKVISIASDETVMKQNQGASLQVFSALATSA